MSISPSTTTLIAAAGLLSLFACSSSSEDTTPALVQLKNDFNNPQITGFQPPWTICKSSYQGQQFGKIDLGQTSTAQEVPAGLDYVLMVAAWADPTCDPARSLPLASKSKEEVVSGQTRTIALGMTNHQGPCPPEGVQPIPEEQYNRILQLWPEYNFKAYADRLQNTKCAGSGGGAGDGGTEAGADTGVEPAGDAGDQ